MVFREQGGRGPELVPLKITCPTMVGFGIDGETYVTVTDRIGGVERWVLSALGADARSTREAIDGPWSERSRCVIHERAWMLVHSASEAYGVLAPGEAARLFRGEESKAFAWPLWFEGRFAVLRAQPAPQGGHWIAALSDMDGRQRLLGSFDLPHSARAPIAACITVHGPVVICATDRPDELDVCALRTSGVEHRTVSLGYKQEFVAAEGGGSRIAIISRHGNDVRMRTIASDLRSELNAVPLAAGVRAAVGNVRVVHGGGPIFVVAHEEHGDAREVVLTVFDDGKTRVLRSKFPGVQGLSIAGKHIAIAALVAGSISPLLYVQQLTLARDDVKGESFAIAPKRRAYLLGEPPTNTPQARRALLVDAAEVLAQSLSAQAPREVVVGEFDGHERVAFIVAGSDAAKDIAMVIQLHDDGSAIVNVKRGDTRAPAPRPLTVIERVRVALTGDDDGDPSTSHFELRSLTRDLGDVVMAVWALKLTR